MNAYRKIARASAVLAAAAMLGAGPAVAQPFDSFDDPGRRGSQSPTVDQSTACGTVGAPLSAERLLCYRSAANLANDGPDSSAQLTRPIVVEGTSFDWADAGVGFAAAAGLGLLGLGSAAAVRSRRMNARLH
jgi:hypothetical protein